MIFVRTVSRQLSAGFDSGFRERTEPGQTRPIQKSKAIALLSKNENIRESLIAKGRKRLSSFSDKDRLSTLCDIFDSYDRKRLCWSIE